MTVEDIEDIFIVGAEIHEGWNIYDIEGVDAYSSYRLINEADAAGCNKIGELELLGWEIHPSIDNDVDCTVEYYYGGSVVWTDVDNLI